MRGRTDTASRVIAAPPEAVYRAFVTPDALMEWLPPASMSGRAPEYDFRVGGRYRIELTYGDAAPAGVGKTTSRTDVRPPARLPSSPTPSTSPPRRRAAGGRAKERCTCCR